MIVGNLVVIAQAPRSKSQVRRQTSGRESNIGVNLGSHMVRLPKGQAREEQLRSSPAVKTQ